MEFFTIRAELLPSVWKLLRDPFVNLNAIEQMQ